MRMPPDLENRMRQYLVQYPQARWDAAVRHLVLKCLHEFNAARGRSGSIPEEGRS